MQSYQENSSDIESLVMLSSVTDMLFGIFLIIILFLILLPQKTGILKLVNRVKNELDYITNYELQEY